MAIRISGAVGGTPESWLSMQQAVDLWDAGIKLKSNPALASLFRQASIAA
jgi:plasmid maintenance system antidote protein VapI